MSTFDKVVAEWLNGVGESLPPTTKQDILTGIKENIERYKAMDDHICTSPPHTSGAAKDKEASQAPAEQSAAGDAAVSAQTNCDEAAVSANEAGRAHEDMTRDILHEAAEQQHRGDDDDDATAAGEGNNDNAAAATADACAHDANGQAADDDCHPHAHAAHHHHHHDPSNNNNNGDVSAANAPRSRTSRARTTTSVSRSPNASPTTSATRRAAAAATTTQPHAPPSLFIIDTSKIDYAFEESVEVALRRLESGKSAPLFGPEPESEDNDNNNNENNDNNSDEQDATTAAADDAAAAPPAAPRDADDTDMTTTTMTTTTTQQPQPPQPYDENNNNDDAADADHDDTAAAAAHTRHRSTSSAEHKNDDADAALSATAEDSTAAKMTAMQGFVFGHGGDDDDDAQLQRAEHDSHATAAATAGGSDADAGHDDSDTAPSRGATASDASQQQQQQHHDGHHHPRSSGDVLDESEDERRRRAQLEHSNPRIGVSDEPLDLARALATDFVTSPKSAQQMAVLTRALERHFLFSALDDVDVARCAVIMPLHTYERGTHLLTRGMANDMLFLILDGEAVATIPHDNNNSNDDGAHATYETVTLGKGSTFGDLGILYECTNDMDVRACTPLHCATIDRTTYKLFVSRAAAEKRARYAALLQRVPFLSALPTHDLLRVAEALKEACYTHGEHLITHGSGNQWLHVLVEGEADVIGRDDAGAPTHITTLRPGDHAGHLECLYHHVAVADVVAASARVRTAKLSRRQFDRLIDRGTRAPLQRDVEEDGSYAYYRATMHSASRPREDTSPAFDEPPVYVARAMHDHEARRAASHEQQAQQEAAEEAAAASSSNDAQAQHDEQQPQPCDDGEPVMVCDDNIDAAVEAAAAEAAEAAVAAAQDERDVACRDEL